MIVYATEMTIAFARSSLYIHLVQSIRWISSVVGLIVGLIMHIDTLGVQAGILTMSTFTNNLNIVHPDQQHKIHNSVSATESEY